VTEADRIRALLVAQVTGSVRWRESVQWLVGAGVTEFWEVGAGKAPERHDPPDRENRRDAGGRHAEDIAALKG